MSCNLSYMNTIYCGFDMILRQNIPTKFDPDQGLYKAPSSAYNAPPFSEGLRGRKGPGAGEVRPAQGDLRAVLTEDDPFTGFCRLGLAVLV